MERELWTQYRNSWEVFSRKLYQLQEFADSGEGVKAAAALLEVKKARVEHNAARDRLANHLAAREKASGGQASEHHRIRKTARLLWEFSGQPRDTAEADWHRAEQLVRAASL